MIAGIIAGTLDALAAIINYYVSTGKNPVKVFVFIASGVFGKDAYTGSQSIAVFGVLFHYLIAIIFSAFYFLIYPKVKLLHINKFFSAFLYGIFVWIIMSQVVVPQSRTPPLPFDILRAVLAVFILIVCVGIPICFIAVSFYKRIKSP